MRILLISIPLFLLTNLSLAKPSLFDFESESPSTSTFWRPTVSFLLPGAGQLLNQQYSASLLYTGVAGSGLALAISAGQDLQSADIFENEFDDALRKFILGSKTFQFAGQLSLYHSFRTAVTNLPNQYVFLKDNDETVDELLLAPFEFGHLKKWTTWLPLSVLTVAVLSSGLPEVYLNDAVFLSAISYEAGVGEEMMFRGWMQPLLFENLESHWAANVVQGTVFGLAHTRPGRPAPVFQTLAGYYFGYLLARNNWSQREGIFLHTWWDVIVFAASLSRKNSAQIQMKFSF